MSVFRLPIVDRWKEAFTTFKDAGTRVTVQGSAWVIRNATVFNVEEHIVVLDVGSHYSRDDKGAMEMTPAMRAMVSYDSIAGVSFERTEEDESPGA
jgi:hypothetical protein